MPAPGPYAHPLGGTRCSTLRSSCSSCSSCSSGSGGACCGGASAVGAGESFAPEVSVTVASRRGTSRRAYGGSPCGGDQVQWSGAVVGRSGQGCGGQVAADEATAGSCGPCRCGARPGRR